MRRVLNKEIAVGHVAVRDEGMPYHYPPPAREVSASSAGVAAIEQVLKQCGVPYLVGKTWMKDAPYRETWPQVQLSRSKGCVAVEMEAAAFFAVAQFRPVVFAQMYYGGDDVSGRDEWDLRGWHSRAEVRENLFWLAAEARLRLWAFFTAKTEIRAAG